MGASRRVALESESVSAKARERGMKKRASRVVVRVRRCIIVLYSFFFIYL